MRWKHCAAHDTKSAPCSNMLEKEGEGRLPHRPTELVQNNRSFTFRERSENCSIDLLVYSPDL